MMNKNFIIELAGLPGSGKSTLAKAINKRMCQTQTSVLNSFKKSRFKLLMSLPLLPYILLRFYRVFKILFFKKFNKSSKKISSRSKISIMATLCISIMEFLISLIISKIKNKMIILDGGYIQWGLSIYIRTPPEIRDQIWLAYLSHLPQNIKCFILTCEPQKALERATQRLDGVPEVFVSRPWNFQNTDNLIKEYEEIYFLLKSINRNTNLNCVYISSENDVNKQADIFLEHLKSITFLKRIFVN